MTFIRIACLLIPGAIALMAADYDPLAIPVKAAISVHNLTMADMPRKRELPLKIYLPESTKPAAVLLFSHGLGGSRENDQFLGEHWAKRGYVAVFMQHAGSDASVWQGKGPIEAMGSLRKAANAENFMLRAKDVPAVLDQLELWNKSSGHFLYNRLDLTRVGMSGHSFGAVTTQAVSGQKSAMGGNLTDYRIKAAVAFSPSVPAAGDPQKAFGSVKIPWMLMTGTEDNSPIGKTTAESRQLVYPALPAGGKYEVVLFGAEHSAFGDRTLRGEKGQRNPNHHRVILALSTAFWDAWLLENKEARTWLDGGGAGSVLEAKDRWQHK